jgi:hypothetical protein
MKCYTIRKDGQTHLVYFCRECHSAFEKSARSTAQDGKAGRAVKGVVGALGALGLLIMTLIFSLTLLTLKQVMKTRYGDDEGEPGLASSDPSFSDDADAPDAAEPMLENFKPKDLMGYEVSDETGKLYPTDDLVRQLYGSEGTFSEAEATFSQGDQTFSDNDF